MNNKVSVCIAAYNGGLYIRSQIDSILSQLSTYDELIIIDDCSTDNTLDILNSYNDERVHLYKNVVNIGHVRNFEKCIEYAKGDIIFLSDQDDLWEASKYKKVTNIFLENPDVSMIYHSLIKINEIGKPVGKIGRIDGKIIFPNRLIFALSQIFKFRVFGCSIAFRRKFLGSILPFPVHITYAHDHWIATSMAVKSKIACINAPLVFYRQHDSNLTPKSGLATVQKIKIRVLLICLLLFAFFR